MIVSVGPRETHRGRSGFRLRTRGYDALLARVSRDELVAALVTRALLTPCARRITEGYERRKGNRTHVCDTVRTHVAFQELVATCGAGARLRSSLGVAYRLL